MMADTNSAAAATAVVPPVAATTGTGVTEAIPQWKKELLQRRKNLAKTIGTAATQVHDSASTVAAALTTTPTTPRIGPGGNPFAAAGGAQKATVTPSSSSPSSPSVFAAPVFVGHSHSTPPATNEQPHHQQQPAQVVLVKSLGPVSSNTTTTTAGTRGVPTAAEALATEQKQPLQHTQSHSNDGTESISSGARSNLVVHSSSLSGSPKGGGGGERVGAGVGAPANSSGPAGKYAAAGVSCSGSSASSAVDCELTRSGETNSYSSNVEIGWKIKKNTSNSSSNSSNSNNNSSSSSSTKMVAASAEEIIYEKNRFVGSGSGTGSSTVEVDTSEELKYGPGIVSKLRCRYLSLALRQSGNKQRPSLNSMRRATSLNNLLDEESEDLSEREHSIDGKDHSPQDKIYHQQSVKVNGRDQYQPQQQQQQLQQQANQMIFHQQKGKTSDEYISTFQKNVQNSYTRSGRQTEKKNEYNRYNKQRGADSLKRARSVEALVRYDHKAWERDIQKENLYSSNDSNVIILDEICTTNGTANNGTNCQTVAMSKSDLIVDCVTIEEKIINGREKGDPKPKRLTSFIDADERPPPDVVKQTMKIFEANANRRGRPVARTNGAAGEVAAKVASYKSIISQEKPPITHPKPPLSPKKPNIIPRSTSPKSNGTANGLKDKPNLPKLDINVIRSNLETTNKHSLATPPPSGGINQNNTSTPLSVRVEPLTTTTYRLKNESAALSPTTTAVVAAQYNKVTPASTTTTTNTMTNRPESPRYSAAAAAGAINMQNNTNSTSHTFVDSPSIQALASKLNTLNIVTSTPTSSNTRSPTPSDPPQAPPRNNILQYVTSDEEDPDDPEDQQREYSINSDRGSDDYDDTQSEDEHQLELDDEMDTLKRVSRSAMENISKAGVTTQFRFNGQTAPSKSHLPSLGSNSNNNNSNSSGGVGSGGAKLLASKKLNLDDHLSSNSSSTSSSPITVPAAVTATPAAATATAVAPSSAVVVTQKPPPVPLSRESLVAPNGLKLVANPNPNNNTSNSHTGVAAAAANNNNINNSFNNLISSNANITSVNSSNSGSKLVVINATSSCGNNNTQQQQSTTGASAGSGGGVGGGGGSDSSSAVATLLSAAGGNVQLSDVKTVNLTAREIEKNQINLEKSEESISASGARVGNVINSKTNNNNNNTNNSTGSVASSGGTGGTGNDTGGAGDFFMAKWGPTTIGAPAATTTNAILGATNNSDSGSNNPLAGLVPLKKKVKAPPPPIEANTMVFNFSDRKDVPDYIENDGIILRPRPRELPKPGESGIVVIGDLTLETSTDPDDSWAMGPPSPCDVEFANANIVINGKSSMRNKTTKDINKFKIQFDDSLTSTFEYPSETSLLEMNGYDDDPDSATSANGLNLLDTANNSQQQSTTTVTNANASGGGGGGGPAGTGAGGGLTFADNGLLSHKNNLLSSMPLGSAPFASYTPVKAAIDTNFELGVTRTPSPSSTTSSSTASSTTSINSSSAINHSIDSHFLHHHHQQHPAQQQQHHPQHQQQSHNSIHHSNNTNGNGPYQLQHLQQPQQQLQQNQERLIGTEASTLLLLNGDSGEPESLQYLKPASDEQTVNWSQGTRVTDLLF